MHYNRSLKDICTLISQSLVSKKKFPSPSGLSSVATNLLIVQEFKICPLQHCSFAVLVPPDDFAVYRCTGQPLFAFPHFHWFKARCNICWKKAFQNCILIPVKCEQFVLEWVCILIKWHIREAIICKIKGFFYEIIS